MGGAARRSLSDSCLDEARAPGLLASKGRHWFSTYRLVFVLADVTHDPAHPRTRVVVEAWARFNGVEGRLYRTLVTGSPAHRMVVGHTLKSIAAGPHSHTLAIRSFPAPVHTVGWRYRNRKDRSPPVG